MEDTTPEADGPVLEEFTAREALAFGAEFVRSLAPSGTAEVLAVAAFLMEYAAAGFELEADDDEPYESGMPAGPLYDVRCAVTPSEQAQVVGLASGRVGLRTAGADGPGVTLAITAKDARGFAAALLNAADDADGTSPLLMFRKAEEGSA